MSLTALNESRWRALLQSSALHMSRTAAVLALNALLSSVWAPAAGGASPSLPAPPSGMTEPAPYEQPFQPGGTYDPAVADPAEFLGRPVGDTPVRYSDLVAYLSKLAESTARVQMVPYGRTYEGRELYYVVISSVDNMERLDAIKASLGRLATPWRVRSDKDFKDIVHTTPAVAWMAYSIHGDELSSTDAAIQVAYQIAAGTDSLSVFMRRQLVVIIDPLQNPDGRERFLGMMEQIRGAIRSWDTQSLEHTGYWSSGRGNHYLFDLNRDWLVQVNPETIGKVAAVLEWNPQLFVDSHEMGAMDTYLFSPPREPYNPNITRNLKKWWKIFSEDQAHAFDRHGWSYYTGEWNEEWYPGYGSSWSAYTGAVGILYEQAGVEGSLVKRDDGTYLSYRETVHHQYVSSMTNLETAARHKDELLEDFYREKRKALSGPTGDGPKAFVFVPGDKPDRVNMLMSSLIRQGIEVKKTMEPALAKGLHDYWGESYKSKKLPAGAYVVPLNQPMGPLAKAALEFDPRMPDSSLRDERYELEKKKRSRIYDMTAWSLPMAFGVEGYEATAGVPGGLQPVATVETKTGSLQNPDAAYGYLIDGGSDKVLRAAVALMEAGYKVRHATKPFHAAGRDFCRGSLLLRARENTDGLSSFLETLCVKMGIDAFGAESALTEKGPDLGGSRFPLLEPPRVCLLGGSPISSSSYGAVWQMLDSRLGLRASRVDIGQLPRTNLDKYNVIVMPHTWGEAYQHVLGKSGILKLHRWIEEGGTLVAMGAAAAAVADTSFGLSKVRQRRQVLDKLSFYEMAFAAEPSAPETIDSLAVWEGPLPQKDDSKAVTEQDENTEGLKPEKGQREPMEKLKAEDERLRLFCPQGAMLRVDLDEEHWLAAGAGEKIPALVSGTYALMSKYPVETVGRFAEGPKMRLSGLLWPEARTRWARTAYLTRESLGKGQIILFLNEPYFRAQYLGTGRLLMNALVLGPGLGTTRPTPW
jgi:hypothetical protein